jgi:suppressor for copper-sensitivity B
MHETRKLRRFRISPMVRACFRFLTPALAAIAVATSVLRADVLGQPTTPLGDFGSPFGGAGDPVVSAEAQFTAPTAGESARLFVTATIKPGWHIYSITQSPGGPITTSIKLAPSDAYSLAGPFLPTRAPDTKAEPLFGGLIVETHDDEITWYAPLELAPGVDPATLTVEGTVRAQACDARSCLPPQNFPFTARLGPGLEVLGTPTVGHIGGPVEPVGPNGTPTPREATPQAHPQGGPPSGPQPATAELQGGHRIPWVRVTTFAEVNKLVEGRIDLAKLEKNVRELEGGGARDSQVLWVAWLVSMGFLGGILLNVMPCVLPVIGLKIFSFVNQAGEHRLRALMLNVAFSAGLISVFLILAALAAGLNLQWGGQFQYPWFNVTMAAVVFAMGLSFVGVWELPVPGFVATGKAAEAAQREGLAGAFFMGIITTLLATPCTGPGMAFAVTMVMSEPPPLIFAVFAAVGLGMASPYLVIGAFPRLVSFLPKPGEWMETFKQVMGFVLFGTTVWILSFIHWPYLVPTVGMMFGAWGACWWIQRKATAELGEKAWAWVEAAAFLGLVWVFMFPGVGRLPGVQRIMNERWQYVTAGAVRATVPPGRYTLMIDFTADWCVNCKAVEAKTLDTEAVRKRLDELHVVPVQFDMTTAPEDAETKQLVQALRVAQPSLAILPAGDPNRPVTILRGLYTQGPVLEGLKKAGPSINRPR